jgi:uncharacterized repeat protein (TIGR03803 family)
MKNLYFILACFFLTSCLIQESSKVTPSGMTRNTPPPIGNIPRLLKSFVPFAQGASPAPNLISLGGALFGTTYGGGTSGYGTVFKINPDGSGFALLKEFNDTDGARPQAALISHGGALYGTTNRGGASGYGTIFSIEP